MDKKLLVWSLIVAAALFTVTIVLGIFTPLDSFWGMGQGLDDFLEPLQTASPVLLLLFIFLNNAAKALGVVVLGILLGLPGVLFVTVNGFVIGAVVSAVESAKGLKYIVASLIPHGVIEIPMLLLATALSFMVGWESFKWLSHRESRVESQLLASVNLYLKVVLPGLAVAAIIEAFVTPWVINLVGG